MLNLDHDKKLGDLAVHLRISLGSSLYAVAVHPRVHCPVCHCPRIPQHAAPPQPQRKVQEKMQAMAQVVMSAGTCNKLPALCTAAPQSCLGLPPGRAMGWQAG